MKTILYVGATLMIGASIYGFVDYKKTSRNKEFTKMYDSKEADEPIINNDMVKEAVVKPEVKNNEKAVVAKKEITVKNEAVNENTMTKKDMPAMEKIIEEKAAENKVLKENTAAKTEKKEKRVLNYKLFSRAPLEKKYVEKELKIEPEKTEQTGTLEKNKEQ